MTRRKPPRTESGSYTVTAKSAGVVRVSPDRREARIGRRYIMLTDEECRLLVALVEEREQVVTRTALMLAAWGTAGPERFAALDKAMSGLRDRLGADVTIETITGIGYRLL